MTKLKIDKDRVLAHIVKSQTKRKLEEFRSYYIEIESKFRKDKEMISTSYDKDIEGLTPDQIIEITEYYSEDYYVIDNINIGIYRNSMLVSLYSLLENSMNSLCRHLGHRDTFPIELEDLKGSGITRAKMYLEKLAKVDFSSINGEWGSLSNMNRIRNCVVHTEGDITAAKDYSTLQSLIERTPGLEINNERYIKIERVYVDLCISKIECFLTKLHNQVFTK